ncbi:unnamed protein product [Miscanthus lutarioriparius]|uniref:Uncharacterized protein n=1 Tax=Miscanthus lutarioriparius TaxID=422564 RepID=A0A811QR41_9POAL|nr:unnamed protein product [Miscanthus lutarioriparius]
MAPYTRQQKSETRLERKVKAAIHVLLDRIKSHRGIIVWRQTKRSRMRQITFWVRDGSKGFTRDCRSRTRAMLFVDLCCMLSRQPQSTARPLTILPTISRLTRLCRVRLTGTQQCDCYYCKYHSAFAVHFNSPAWDWGAPGQHTTTRLQIPSPSAPSNPIQSAPCSLSPPASSRNSRQTQPTEEKQTKTASSEKGEQSSTKHNGQGTPQRHRTGAPRRRRRSSDDDHHQHQPRGRCGRPPTTGPGAAAGADGVAQPRKSLLLSCSGFTVYDASGALAFRVDCYDSARRGLRRRAAEVVLMDVAGTPLLTVRRRSRLTSLGLAPDRWLIFDGDAAAGAGCRRPNKAKPFMSVRRARLGIGLGLLGASSGKAPLAYVTPLQAQAGEAYVVEGSYGARSCAVREARGDAVAEVRRKERVGDDVFRLVAGPHLGAPLAMALVIALDEMFAAGAGSGSGSGSGSAQRPSLLRRTWSARGRGNLPCTDCEREQTCELQENKATICKDTETYSGRVASFKCLMPIVYTAVVSVIP